MDTEQVDENEGIEWRDEDTGWIFFSPFLIARHVYDTLFVRTGEAPDLNTVGWNVRRHHGLIVEREKLEGWMEQFKFIN